MIANPRRWGFTRTTIGGDVVDRDGCDGLTEADAAEVDRRAQLVRSAKREKHAASGGHELTPWELDAVLPPHDNARTRRRFAYGKDSRGERSLA